MMGLLSKAQVMNEREKTQNKEGLLSAASRFSGSKTGLLERAEEMMQSEESEAEETESQGLLKKATSLQRGEGLGGPTKEVGLLEKAETIRKEADRPSRSKEEEEQEPSGRRPSGRRPSGRRPSGLLEKVSVVEEFEAREAAPPDEVLPPVTAKQAPKKVRARSKMKAAEKKKKVKKAAEPKRKKRPAAAEQEEKVPEAAPETTSEPGYRLLAQRVRARDFTGSRRLLSGVLSESGSKGLFDLLLETGCELSKGRSGMLFSLSEKRYRVIAGFFSEKPKHTHRPLTYGLKSTLVNLLQKYEDGPLLSSRAVKALPKRDAGRLKDLEPWAAIPVTAGTGIAGFYLFGERPGRAKSEKDLLSFLAFITAPFLIDYSLREEIKGLAETRMREREESGKLLGLYHYGARMGKKGLLRGALDRCASLFHIETAILVTGWETKGELDVSLGIGVTDEERKRIKVSKRDGEILGIIKRGDPGVPKDTGKRLGLLKKELERDFKSYIVVPVTFHGTCLAVLVVLDMKGVKKRLPSAARFELSHTAGFLVPYLLYEGFNKIDSFNRLESQVERAVRESEREGGSLAMVTCTVRNIDKNMEPKRYEEYRAFFESIRRCCVEIVADDGWVETVSFKRILLFIRDLDAERVDGIAGRVRERFAQMAKKEDFSKLALTVGKKENTGLYGLLKEIY